MADAVPPSDPENAPPAPITPIDITDELEDSYLAYAQSVMVSRALPDVRDGLKPSQRRILVAMHDLGLSPTSTTTKCAGIIGETMKRYHPHGDASIYDALVRMAQDWVMRAKLIQGQGNFGSIAGLPPAAHRYTEAKLSPVAWEMLDDLDRDTVDYIDNYDGKYREPLVLPCRFPNLLVNGSDGIAVGMATDIPPHNPHEVCQGLIALIDNPEIELREILQFIKGPDFPTGGIVMGRQGMWEGYNGRRGRITLRARATIIPGEKGRGATIIINEVPYQLTRNKLSADIGELVKDERIKDIAEFRDESAARKGEPVRLVLELKKNSDPHLVLNQLYQLSPLQKTISIGMLALVDGRPLFLTLKEMMQKFLDHRFVVIRRRTEYLLREAKRRSHVLEGQLIAISSIEEVIRICRSAPSRAEAKIQLMGMEVSAAVMERALGAEAFKTLQEELGLTNVYRMTEAQAEAVVNLRLGQLAALERDEILKEFRTLREQIRGYEDLLGDEGKIKAIIRADLEMIRDKYCKPRSELSTQFDEGDGFIEMEELIVDEPTIVTISHEGFLKRMPPNTYKVQNRGGRGVQGGTREDDFIEHFFVASTKDYLLVFTDKGQVYWLKVYQIPQATRTSPGRAMANVLSLKENEKVAGVIAVKDFAEGFHLTMATRKGQIKKTDLMEYSRPRANGIIGILLAEGDEVIAVALTQQTDEILLCTGRGQAIRFGERTIRSMGRNTRGVRGIRLVGDDEVVGMAVADPEGYLLSVCENGFGKRTPFGPNIAEDSSVAARESDVEEPDADVPEVVEEEGDENSPSSMRYPKRRRGGKGVRDIKTSERNGKVVAVLSVRDNDEIMVISEQGMVTRMKVDSVRITGRNAQGVKLMKPQEGDKLVTVAKVAADALSEAETAPPASEPTP